MATSALGISDAIRVAISTAGDCRRSSTFGLKLSPSSAIRGFGVRSAAALILLTTWCG